MFKGSIVALVTPFCDKGIDLVALEKMIEMHIKADTKGIVIAGTTGEGTLLTLQERKDLIENAIKFANKRIPIIVGCSTTSTDETVQLAKEAKESGADAILVMTPFYVKPTQEGIYQHFKAINDAVDLPVIVYNHPGRSGLDIKIETMVRIFELSHVVSLKDSNIDMDRARQIKSQIAPYKTLLSGDDPTVIDYLKAGGVGCISVSANIEPEKCQHVMNFWFQGDVEKAKALNDSLMPLHDAMGFEPNPQPVKYILYKKGMMQPLIKAPLLMPTNDVARKLDLFI